jgi:predicted O-methyltransferase YrrM
MIEQKRTFDLSGREREVTGGINSWEADFFQSLIEQNELRVCLETGVAYGVSTIAICEALSRLDGDRKLFGIDPCQHTDYGGAALAGLKACGVDHLFELMEGPSHIMLPRLLEIGVKLDLAFIDGWHTFDYTLLDVFYADKMLKPGGFLLMHDMEMPSKRRVASFLRTHRKYHRIAGPARPLARRLLSFGKNVALFRPASAVRIAREILDPGFLFVARKVVDWEPDYNFFSRF